MAFDPSKDKVLFTERHEGGLQISVNAYNGGEPKMQIGPRYVQTQTGEGRRKAGRMSADEVAWLLDKADKLLDIMEGVPAESSPKKPVTKRRPRKAATKKGGKK